MFGGLCLAFPVIAAQVWLFVAPGLYRHERNAFLPFLLASPVLFIAGGAFVFYVMLRSVRRYAIVGLFCIALVSLCFRALSLPPARSFFELAPVSWKLAAASLGGAAVSIVFLYLVGFPIGRPTRSS